MQRERGETAEVCCDATLCPPHSANRPQPPLPARGRLSFLLSLSGSLWVDATSIASRRARATAAASRPTCIIPKCDGTAELVHGRHRHTLRRPPLRRSAMAPRRHRSQLPRFAAGRPPAATPLWRLTTRAPRPGVRRRARNVRARRRARARALAARARSTRARRRARGTPPLATRAPAGTRASDTRKRNAHNTHARSTRRARDARRALACTAHARSRARRAARRRRRRRFRSRRRCRASRHATPA